MPNPALGIQQEIKQTRPFRSLGAEAAVALLRTADAVRTYMAKVVEPHGITVQQYNVLRILKGSFPNPLPTLEIGERMIERQPGITRLLDRLDAKKLVRRERCTKDRRLMHCWITDAGRQLLEGLDPKIDEADRRTLSSLPEREVRQLIDLMQSIRATVK